MNSFEMKQEARRERLERRAEKARLEAVSRFKRADEAVEGIPFGQPILVGHHSEGRHRAALKRCDTNMRKGFEAKELAAHYAGAADGVGKGGISSDDPDAIVKLQERLVELQEKHARIKARVHDNYEVSNSGANIRRVRARISWLARNQAAPEAPDEAYPGVVLVQNRELNRVQLKFEAIPSPEMRKRLKSAGFRWSPNEKAWQRQLGSSAVYQARDLVKPKEGQ